MKVAIMGDSHGQIDNIDRAMKKIDGMVDVIFHTGDIYSDIKYIRKNYNIKILGVKGNCDSSDQPQEELIEEIGGKRFFVTHGHKYNVKYNLNNIFYRGKEVEADIVIFGHSHVPYYTKESDMLLLNPGSISLPRGGSDKGFLLLTLQSGEIEVERISISM